MHRMNVELSTRNGPKRADATNRLVFLLIGASVVLALLFEPILVRAIQ